MTFTNYPLINRGNIDGSQWINNTSEWTSSIFYDMCPVLVLTFITQYGRSSNGCFSISIWCSSLFICCCRCRCNVCLLKIKKNRIQAGKKSAYENKMRHMKNTTNLCLLWDFLTCWIAINSFCLWLSNGWLTRTCWAAHHNHIESGIAVFGPHRIFYAHSLACPVAGLLQ